ncbi:pre-mRNA-processing factor 17-like [Sycon ciliatum]|uniref:pre-mRNA-processing factor 17-like n=1 Tax=Sycon ciliatum TaxID=27933 RepID=UPI0031F5FEFB
MVSGLHPSSVVQRLIGEETVSRPSEEQQVVLDKYNDAKVAQSRQKDDKTIDEKTQLHIHDPLDYQGGSFLHAPRDLDVDFHSEDGPDKCFLPKRCIHTWTGHTKGVSAIRIFPNSGHLLLSASMDSKVKLWEVYNDRRLVRTYTGHSKAVRDISFNNDGTRFLTASYDRYVKMFDTETGQCIGRYTPKKIPYCVKFNPDEDKQHIFLCGTSDKKIVQWDTTSGDIMQEYDRHLCAVDTISFIDDSKRIVSTSDDKSVRVWEWEIPVDSKYIAEPSMHAVSSVGMSRNNRWMVCQSSDNQIRVYDAAHKMRLNKKKTFKGHKPPSPGS